MKKCLFVALAMTVSLGVPVVAGTPADCMSCHDSTDAEYPLLGARLGNEVSGHATLGNSRYANATGCQRCHTNEGYVQYVKMDFDTAKYDLWANSKNADGSNAKDASGKSVPVPYINYPSQPGCFTCHNPHRSGDFTLRTQTVDPKTAAVSNQKITLYDKTVFDGGSGNLCASCHQARGNVQTATAAQKGMISPRGASHHGPEADMLVGANGYEFAGMKYFSSPHYSFVDNTCIGCHMVQPEARYGFSPEIGGHAFTVVGDVHEAELGNVANCIGCHKDIKTVAAKKYINTTITALKNTVYFTIKAKKDYDGNGKVEFVQQEVQGLLDRLVNVGGTGVMQKMANPMFKPDGSFIASKTAYTEAQLGAYANLMYVIEDKSLGVHNSVYTIELLMDSIKAIDPSYDAANRP
ncbi:MAG: hypothetical protein ACOYM2_04640 [Rectinemataceae bacterium]